MTTKAKTETTHHAKTEHKPEPKADHKAHAKPHGEPCDGWHFVRCPKCHPAEASR